MGGTTKTRRSEWLTRPPGSSSRFKLPLSTSRAASCFLKSLLGGRDAVEKCLSFRAENAKTSPLRSGSFPHAEKAIPPEESRHCFLLDRAISCSLLWPQTANVDELFDEEEEEEDAEALYLRTLDSRGSRLRIVNGSIQVENRACASTGSAEPSGCLPIVDKGGLVHFGHRVPSSASTYVQHEQASTGRFVPLSCSACGGHPGDGAWPGIFPATTSSEDSNLASRLNSPGFCSTPFDLHLERMIPRSLARQMAYYDDDDATSDGAFHLPPPTSPRRKRSWWQVKNDRLRSFFSSEGKSPRASRESTSHLPGGGLAQGRRRLPDPRMNCHTLDCTSGLRDIWQDDADEDMVTYLPNYVADMLARY